MNKDMKYTTLQFRIHNPKPIYLWDFFGDGMFLIDYLQKVSWWKKFWTKLFFGSKWSEYKYSEDDFGDDDRSIDK